MKTKIENADYNDVLELAGVEYSELVEAVHCNGNSRLSVKLDREGNMIDAAWNWSLDCRFGEADWFIVFSVGHGSQDCHCDICKAGPDSVESAEENTDWIGDDINTKLAGLWLEFNYRQNHY